MREQALTWSWSDAGRSALCVIPAAAVVAVVDIFFVAYGSAILASHRAVGLVAMTLCAPVAAVGLSYSDLGEAAGLGLLMVAGSTWSFGVLVLWPQQPAPATPEAPALLPAAFARRYGILLGLAAASSAAVGEALHSDHVGWATAAAMFVMRPSAEMQELRSALQQWRQRPWSPSPASVPPGKAGGTSLRCSRPSWC